MSREIVESRPGAQETSSQQSLIANMVLVLVTLAIVVMGLYFGLRWLVEHAPLFWDANSGWLLPTIIIVVIGGSAPWTVPCAWRVFKAVTSFRQEMKERESYRLLLVSTKSAIDNGRDVELVNSKTGDMIKVKSALPMPGHVVVTEGEIDLIPEKSSTSVQSVRIPQAPPFASVIPLIQGERFVLCYVDEQGASEPVFGTVDDLLSTNVNGKPGRGKTSLLYFIIAQILKVAGLCRRKAGITVFDPHGSMMELSGVFTYVHNYEEMATLVPRMEQMIDDRLELFKQRKDVGHPHLLVIDEAPAIAAWETKQRELVKQKQRDSVPPSILSLVQRIILEARKVRMYVIVAGQSLPATVLPTIARDNLSSHFVFFSSNSHAKMAGLEKQDIERLLPHLKDAGSGVCVVDAARLSGADIGAIPYTTIDDLLTIVRDDEHVSGAFYRAQTIPLPEQRATFVTSVTQDASSAQSSQIAREDMQEDAQEAGGKDEKADSLLENPFELKRLLLEIGKMKEKGVSNDAILKHYGLKPGGRNNQNIKAIVDVISELDTQAGGD